MDFSLLRPGDAVLELGGGPSSPNARKFRARKCGYFCIDKEPRAKVNLAEHYIEGDFETIPFPFRKFSLVIARYSLHYNRPSRTRAVIKKIKNTLVPRGSFYGIVHSREDQGYRRMLREEYRRIGTGTIESNEGKIIHYYTERELLDLLRDFNVRYIRTFTLCDPGTSDAPEHVHRSIEFLAENK